MYQEIVAILGLVAPHRARAAELSSAWCRRARSPFVIEVRACT
jgi:hypothetical protein